MKPIANNANPTDGAITSPRIHSAFSKKDCGTRADPNCSDV
jgi:hypothetical protein